MFQRKPRRFKRRSNGRGYAPRGIQTRLTSNSFSNSFSNLNGHNGNNFRTSSLSPEKLFEKYNSLAKEASTSGDKTLSENYFQHADHFMRIIENKNKNRNQDKNEVVLKPTTNEKNLTETTDINQNDISKNKD